MQKNPLIGVSILAVVLLIFGSLTNVVGFQTVQSSNQKPINGEVDQIELLFKTIIDIANNKEIQKIALNSEIKRDGFFNSDIKFSVFTSQVLTKSQLKHMYLIGLILSKTVSKSKIHSMVEQYQVSNQEMQKEITTVIEKDATLNSEIAQLSNSKCDCENANTTSWSYPVLCFLLFPLFVFAFALWVTHINTQFVVLIENIGAKLNCFWMQ
jgi:hypothetical protein